MATAQSHRYRPSNALSSICLHAHAPGPRCDLGGCRCPGPHEKTRYDIIQNSASAQPGPGEPGSHANIHGLDRGRARSLPRCVAVRVGVRQPELPGVDGPRPSARHLPVRHDVGRRERFGRDVLGTRARPDRRRSLQPAHPACSRNSVRRRSFRRRGVQQVVRFAHRQDDRPPTAHFIEGLRLVGDRFGPIAHVAAHHCRQPATIRDPGDDDSKAAEHWAVDQQRLFAGDRPGSADRPAAGLSGGSDGL